MATKDISESENFHDVQIGSPEQWAEGFCVKCGERRLLKVKPYTGVIGLVCQSCGTREDFTSARSG